MNDATFIRKCSLCVLTILCVPGCSGRLDPVVVPSLDPDAAADGALEMYDSDNDGRLSESEIANSPPLRSAVRSFDRNGDKEIDREELLKKFTEWANSKIGASNLACRVILGGKPLEGAQVELIPEEYLKDTFQPATGVTSRKGIATMAIDSAYLPDDLQRLRAVHQGLYRVAITHASIDIPAKYNTETELGLEISFGTGNNLVHFKL